MKLSILILIVLAVRADESSSASSSDSDDPNLLKLSSGQVDIGVEAGVISPKEGERVLNAEKEAGKDPRKGKQSLSFAQLQEKVAKGEMD